MYNTGMLKDDTLKDKVILITGGGTGLGRSMGNYFLKLGAKLIISSRKIDVLKKTADEMMAETGGNNNIRQWQQQQQLQQIAAVSRQHQQRAVEGRHGAATAAAKVATNSSSRQLQVSI